MPDRKPHKFPTKAEILEALTDRVRALRLQPGDILVTQDYDAMEALSEQQIAGIDFEVPVICAPNGIEKISVNELEFALGIAKDQVKGVKSPKRKGK